MITSTFSSVMNQVESWFKLNKPESLKTNAIEPKKSFTKGDWDSPIPLKSKLLPVEMFTYQHLPPVLADFVSVSAVRLDNAAAEYTAISLLTCMSGILGNSTAIQPKQFDSSWLVVPTLWCLAIGEPSQKKSPSLAEGISALEATLNKFESRTDKQDLDFVVFDATVEALIKRLESNKTGVLVFIDEISSWLGTINRPERGLERGFYLSGFNGNANYRQDRTSRDTVYVESVTISMMGGIQPSLLQSIFRERASGKNDGLFERFQLMVFPDENSRYTDIKPNDESKQALADVFQLLLSIRLSEQKIVFKFDEHAQKLWNTWSTQHSEREKVADSSLKAAYGKYPALVAKLSLIFHIASNTECFQSSSQPVITKSIGIESLKVAFAWIDLLTSHQKRVSAFIADNHHYTIAEALLQKVSLLGNYFSFRDLQRKQWSDLKTRDDCKQALESLVAHGYLREGYIKQPNGRMVERFEIHPDYLEP